MAEEVISEVIQLMTFMSQDEIRAALEEALKYDLKEALQAAFRSPGPKVSPRPAAKAAADWNSPSVRQHRFALALQTAELQDHPTIRQFQHHHTYEDGTKAGFEVEYQLKPKINMNIDPELEYNFKSLWKGTKYNAKAEDRASDFLEMINRLATTQKRMDMLMDAAEKCGIPKTRAEMLAKNGKIENVIKAAMTRKGAKDAAISGVWQSALLTAAFDINRLFDGEFKTYFVNIGISGLHGGTVAGLSSWINNPYFSNSIVLGAVVGSAFGAASLVSTGDWARFGKGLGCNIVGGAVSWGGATAGGALGFFVLGPIGFTFGTMIGGMCGGVAGRAAAARVPGLGGRTKLEISKIDGAIRQQLAAAGLEPDPSLTPEQVVEATLAKGAGGGQGALRVRMTDAMASQVTDLRELLASLQQVSPETLLEFRDLLRAARSSM